MNQLSITMLENVVLQFFAGLGNAFAIAIAAYQCAGGHMEPDALVYALFLIGACFAPMSNLINAWHMGYRGVVASYSIVELQNQPVRLSLLPKEGSAAKTPAPSDVRFENVSFAYDPADGDVLHGISFDVPHAPRPPSSALPAAANPPSPSFWRAFIPCGQAAYA